MKNTYKEIWVDADDGQSMCALINGNQGWLMYLREEGDAGFHSINPNYGGGPDEIMKFVLNNGQCDEYPMSYVLPIEQVEQALEYFKKETKPPTFIIWHNDSEDGTEIV